MSETRRKALDPAVSALITEGERRQRRRRMDRVRQAKARRDAARQRATYDIPKSLQQAIAAVAKEESLSVSGLVSALLADGVRRYRRGEITFYGLKRLSRSPRCDWVIDAAVIEQILEGVKTLENRDSWTGRHR